MKHWYDQYFLLSEITAIWLSGYTSQVKKKDFLSGAPNIMQARCDSRNQESSLDWSGLSPRVAWAAIPIVGITLTDRPRSPLVG